MVLTKHSLLTSIPHCVAALCLILSSQKLSSPPTTMHLIRCMRRDKEGWDGIILFCVVFGWVLIFDVIDEHRQIRDETILEKITNELIRVL
jgi:hypothetical protein